MFRDYIPFTIQYFSRAYTQRTLAVVHRYFYSPCGFEPVEIPGGLATSRRGYTVWETTMIAPMSGLWPWLMPVLLLAASNVFMTLAWYGHLNFKASPHGRHTTARAITRVATHRQRAAPASQPAIQRTGRR